jgi:hypothetical protein
MTFRRRQEQAPTLTRSISVRSFLLFLAACSTRAESAPTTHDVTPAHAPVVASSAQIVGVHIVAAVGDSPASTQPAYARRDQTVKLFAVLDVEETNGKRTRFSDAPGLAHARPLTEAPRVELRWNRIESAVADLSNGDGKDFHFEPIDYRATVIEGARAGTLVADVHPTLTIDHGNGVGTMRYQLVALQGERTIASPGIEARRGKGSGGLTDAVMRVSIRRDDTYLGFLTEMFNQPYIWASAGLSDATHQSDRLEGSDCADFVVYGARRMGAKIAYTYTGGLPSVTKLIASGARGEDGIYRDAGGTPIAFSQPGDLLLFPRHVGVLVEDRGTKGVLDDQDIMMHTLFDSPKEQPLADTGYADKPVELRRFTADLRRGR